MRTIGVEVEMADIRTWDAARLVAKWQNLKLGKWADRDYGYNKPPFNPTYWTVVSDGTIQNSDGTRCMHSFVDPKTHRKCNVSKTNPRHRFLWKGAELVSPPLKNYKTLDKHLSGILPVLVANGATMCPELNCAYHVHIDISDIPFSIIKTWPRTLLEIQDLFDGVCTFWRGKTKFTNTEVTTLESCETPQAFWSAYRNDSKSPLSQSRHSCADKVRRTIDISPYFNRRKRHKTIEFRCFRAWPTAPPLVRCAEIAVTITNSLIEQRAIDLHWLTTAIQSISKF